MSEAAAAPLGDFDPLAASAGTRLPYALLDVFTETPLHGNALAVFTAAPGVGGEQMQQIAREMNLSETVFCEPPREGGDIRVRIFTPAGELSFAGHPVLGTAILAGLALGREELAVETGEGVVPLRLHAAPGGAGAGWMRRPAPAPERWERSPELLAALGAGEPRLPVLVYRNGPEHVMVALRDAAQVAALVPDMRAVESLGPLAVSCFAVAGDAVRTRMFAPGLGVPEDPATGSAAGPLAVHLAGHGLLAPGREIEIRQGEEVGRPSLLRARVIGSPDRIEAMEVGGAAVIVGRGELAL